MSKPCKFPPLLNTQTATWTKQLQGVFYNNAHHSDGGSKGAACDAIYDIYHLNLTQDWLKKLRIKINETKSVHITFALRKGRCPPVTINNVEIPTATVTRYLGMHLDHKLSWRDHIVMKRKQIELKVK